MLLGATEERGQMSALFGPAMLMVFCLSQALRDVYFASVFQGVDFFAVIVAAFGLSGLGLGAAAAIRAPGEFARLRGRGGTVLAMNLTTALAWTSYFYALKHLEPAVVNTVHSGMAPLTVVVLGLFGVPLAQQGVVGRREGACSAGIALTLAALWWVVLSGHSGHAPGSVATDLLGLALLAVSGASITVSHLHSKRLHDAGVGAAAVTSVRYVLIVAVSLAVLAFDGAPGVTASGEMLVIAFAAALLIGLPTYVFQVGVAHTAPLATQIIKALGPVWIFALQQVDGRLTYSTPTLLCILAYSTFVIASNLMHGWRDRSVAASSARPVPEGAAGR
jgi:hypothetical protein